jgi:hypothetical protein
MKSTPSNEIAKIVAGNWTGTVSQVMQGHGVEFKVMMKLQLEDDTITGTSLLDLSNIEAAEKTDDFVNILHLDIFGTVYKDRFLNLTYENTDKKILHFGSIIIDLDSYTSGSDEKFVEGLFVGYGANSKNLVTGHVALTK